MFKNLNQTDRRIMIAAVLLLLLFSYLLYDDSFLRRWTQPDDQVIAQIVEFKNDVRQKYSSEFQWDQVRNPQAIYFGDSLFTGDDSIAWIELPDGSQFYVNQNSLVVFNATAEQMQIALKFGTIGGVLDGFLKLDGLDLCGKNAKVQITAKGDGTYDVDSAGGAVYTDCEKKKPKLVTKTTPLRVPTAIVTEPPEITYPLANSEIYFKVDHTGVLTEANAVNVKWRHKKIARYELQIAKDLEFKEVISSQQSNNKAITSPSLERGTYFARVRDVQDPKNMWSQIVQFKVLYSLPTPLEAPELTMPDLVYRVPNKRPLTIEWAPVKGAQKYQFELSPNESFEQKVSFTANTPEITLEKYEPGRFYYRVSAISKLGAAGSVSGPGRLRIIAEKPILDLVPPKETAARHEDDLGDPTDFTLSWSSNPLAESYTIEVADNPEFAKAIQYESKDPATAVTIPKVGEYHWRVQPKDKKSKPLSQFSDPGQISYRFKDLPLPPKLLEPMNNVTLFFQASRQTPFWLEWKSSARASHYTIEVSRDPNFEKILIKKDVQQSRLLLSQKLPEGILYWRVKLYSTDQKESIWSDVRSFQLFAGRKAASE